MRKYSKFESDVLSILEAESNLLAEAWERVNCDVKELKFSEVKRPFVPQDHAIRNHQDFEFLWKKYDDFVELTIDGHGKLIEKNVELSLLRLLNGSNAAA